MAKTNEVVTFGDLYAMTSFLSNAELLFSQYCLGKTYTVNFQYDTSKLFIIFGTDSSAILSNICDYQYFLITKNFTLNTMSILWNYVRDSKFIYATFKSNFTRNNNSKTFSFTTASGNNVGSSYFSEMSVTIYEIFSI